jgi:hypothetical protein
MARAELRGPLRNNIIVSGARAGLASVAAVALGIGALRLARLADAPASQRRAGSGSSTARAADRDKKEGLLVVGSDD